MKFLAFVVMVAVVAPLSQCHTFRRIPTGYGTLGWELKLEDENVAGYRQGVVAIGDHQAGVAPGLHQHIGKTYVPTTHYKTPTNYEQKKLVYAVVPEVPNTPNLVHKAHYQPKFQPSYQSTVYHHPTTVRAPLHRTIVPTVHKNEYTGVPHYHGQRYGKVSTVGVHTPNYSHDVVSHHYYHH